MSDELKAPFPWFGGKSRVAGLVWDALGDVQHYVEPFAGSLAVLLGRPTEPQTETVNDKDAYLCNFWRALAHDPERVAALCDWPVNETDLTARHLWLVNEGRERIARMEADPDFYDAKVAAWWVWGINAWIGGGWCSGKGPWVKGVDGKIRDVRQLPHLGNPGQGVNRKRPHLGNPGRGVNRQLPHLGNPGRGVNRQLPHLGNPGRGVNRKRPHLGNPGQGVNRQLPHLGSWWNNGMLRIESSELLTAYFLALASRLRKVRVCCGDWQRVVTEGALAYGDSVGIFLDPPYLGEVRDKNVYRVDDHEISHAVRDWCLTNGNNPRFRIVLAGYWQEHADKMPANWRVHRYSANAAMQHADGGGKNKENRHNETLWFSPHCLQPQPELFSLAQTRPGVNTP